MTVALIVALLGPVGLRAQGRDQERERWNRQAEGVRQSRLGWTIAGAAGGFGLGVYLGFKYFDDAIYSERKIWTTTIVSAIAGGVAGYLIGHARRQRTPSAAPAPPMRAVPEVVGVRPVLRVEEPPLDRRFARLFAATSEALPIGDWVN
jgi:hypothetical protein